MIPLPRRASSLHGRDRELDAMVDFARRRSVVRVTVTGVHGIGKTRLLDEARKRLGTEKTRARFFEATSAVLETDADHEIALGPLGVPREGSDAAGIRRSASVRLMADAARIDLEALAFDALEAMAHLARSSDGHPVVLEQIAGFLAIGSPLEIARLLDERSIEVVPRAFARRLARALRGLDASAREVLASVAAASAPFDLAMARAAVRAQRRGDVTRAVTRLVAGGWLHRSGTPDEPRFAVLAPFRPIVGHDRAGARRRITDFLAGRAQPLLEQSVADRVRVSVLLSTRAELVASWTDAHQRRSSSELALAVALASAATSGDRDVRGHASRIRASIEAHPRAARRARLEIAYGDALWFSGSPADADAQFESAVRRARASADATTEAFGWIRRATLGPELGRLGLAHAQLAEAERLLPRVDEPLVATLAAGIRGFVLRAQGELEGALAAFDEQRERAQRAGDVFYAANADASAADCNLALGRHSLGRMLYERAFRAIRNVDPPWARTLQGYMGLAAWEVGALADAVSHCRRSIAGAVGPRFRGIFGAALAGALAELGEAAGASRALARAEEAALETSAPVAQEAIRVATMLVARTVATDGPSRRAVAKQMSEYVRSRKAANAEDERAFVRSLERALAPVRATTAPVPRLDLADHPRLEHFAGVLFERCAGGKIIGAHDLFRAAWPDAGAVERVTAEARVRKAISLLRARGLRGRIVTKNGGYALTA